MIVALIPARAGSKRVPNKNLEKVGHLTLTEHAIVSAKTVPEIKETFVSSDSSEILSLAKKHGVNRWPRDKSACTDDATDRDVIMDFLDEIIEEGAKSYYSRLDMIVYLRPTTPFRKTYDIQKAIQKMKNTPRATGLRSVHEMSESAYKCFHVYEGGILSSIFDDIGRDVEDCNDPNHFYPKTYVANGVVDIMRVNELLKGKTFGNSVMAHVTEPVIEIDTPHDLSMARCQWPYLTGRGVV